MTTLTFTVGGTAMPLPREDQPYDSEYLGFGTQFRAADATLKTQHIGNRWRRRIFWHGLSAAERLSLAGAFASLVTTATTVVFPDGTTITAQATLGSWSEGVWFQPGSDRPYYNVTFTIEEV